MTRYTGKLKVYIASSLILTLICSALYVAAYLTGFEPQIAYFKAHSLAHTFARAVLIISLLWVASIFITVPKAESSPAARRGKASRAAAAVSAVVFLAYAAYRIVTGTTADANSPLLPAACIFLAVVSAVYFIIDATRSENAEDSGSSGVIAAGFAPIFWAAAAMTDVYTDKYLAMNNPLKIIFIVTMISMMFFILHELRADVGRGRPRAYVVFALFGILLSAVFASSALVMGATGKYFIKSFFSAAFVSAAMAAYMVCRLLDFIRGTSRHTDDATTHENTPEPQPGAD